MIAVSSARVTDDPADEYFQNQSRAFASWNIAFEAIVFFGPPQPHLTSPKTRFIPSENYPHLIDMVDLCADQTDWACLINADIVVTPTFLHAERRLKDKKAVATSSWRWEFDPAVGIAPCHHVDNGLDFFAAVPGAWGQLYENMHTTPQGEHDAAKHLRFGGPGWDSWMLGAFFKLFSHLGFYNITGTKCIRHPIHGNRRHATGVPEIHFLGWPCMPTQDLY